MTTGTKLLAATALFLCAAAPAGAKLVKFSVTGVITDGGDGGNDLVDVTNGPGGYAEVFAPGSIFGTLGDLTGKTVTFSLIYDTNSPFLPIGSGGVFEDAIGDWAYSLKPTITVGGVTREILHVEPVFNGIALDAMLALSDGSSDALAGHFNSFAFSGDVITNYTTAAFGFDGLLPAGFFSTDAFLPGQLPGPGYGFASAAATGSGTFSKVYQSCFLTCSYKSATATFDLTRVSFGAVPETATWVLLLVGFGLVGTTFRRRSATVAA